MGLKTVLRPEMVNFKPPSDVNEASSRLQPNLDHFQVNYFCMVIFITTIYVSIINPYTLIGVGILLSIGIFLLKYTEPIKIGDSFITIAMLARVYILLSVIVYASFAGIHFPIALLISILFVMIHAVMHEVEMTRGIQQISNSFDVGNSDILYSIKRSYDLFLVAIGAEESSEVYNMAAVPRFIAKEIKQDVKEIKDSMRNLFK